MANVRMLYFMVWKEYRFNAESVLIRHSDEAKGWMVEESGLGSRQEQEIFLFPTKSDQLWGPPIFLYSVCPGLFH
jgi:hypothetical protein